MDATQGPDLNHANIKFDQLQTDRWAHFQAASIQRAKTLVFPYRFTPEKGKKYGVYITYTDGEFILHGESYLVAFASLDDPSTQGDIALRGMRIPKHHKKAKETAIGRALQAAGLN